MSIHRVPEKITHDVFVVFYKIRLILTKFWIHSAADALLFFGRLSDRPLPFGVTHAVSLSLVVYLAAQILTTEKKTKVNSVKSRDDKSVVKC